MQLVRRMACGWLLVAGGAALRECVCVCMCDFYLRAGWQCACWLLTVCVAACLVIARITRVGIKCSSACTAVYMDVWRLGLM